ncbi:MAG: class I SAM-dependent methyltransferase, partial [Endomicrobiia bacterium]
MNRKQFFDKLSESWDKKSENSKKRKKIIEQKIFPLLKKFVKPNHNVLDLGCGTGILLPYLKSLVGKKGKVYALDFSEKMLNKAKEKFGNEIFYIKANAHNLPFKKEKFESVVCLDTFPHFVDKFKVIKEINRILKPKGYFVITHSENKHIVNKHHKKVGGVVKNDLLPEEDKLFLWLKKTNFVIKEF